MQEALIQPTATIVAALIASQGKDGEAVDVKAEFIRVYQLLLAAKKEMTPPPRKGGMVPLRI